MTAPVVTFLLVARDEEHYVERAMRAALAQDLPAADLELIVVVDPASRDGTEDIARRVAEGAARSVRVVRAPRPSLAEGWNEGIRLARGRYVLRIDVHGDVPPDFARRNLDAAAGVANDVIVGCTCLSLEADEPGSPTWRRAVFLAETSAFGSSASSFRRPVSQPRFAATVGFPLIARRVFEREGLFRPLAFSQDTDLFGHLAKIGYRFLQIPGLVATYHTRARAAKAVGQKWRNGIWVGRLALGPTGPGRLTHAVPFFYVATVAVLALAAPVLPAAGVAAAAVAALHTAACAAVAFVRCGAREWRFAPGVFMLLLAFHWAYGAGFAWGLATYRGAARLPRPRLPTDAA